MDGYGVGQELVPENVHPSLLSCSKPLPYAEAGKERILQTGETAEQPVEHSLVF